MEEIKTNSTLIGNGTDRKPLGVKIDSDSKNILIVKDGLYVSPRERVVFTRDSIVAKAYEIIIVENSGSKLRSRKYHSTVILPETPTTGVWVKVIDGGKNSKKRPIEVKSDKHKIDGGSYIIDGVNSVTFYFDGRKWISVEG